jgi:hypothetical protein
LVVWMDRALFKDKLLIDFIIIYCFLVFNFEFYFLQRYCTKVVPLCVIGVTLMQICQSCWQFSGKFVTGGKMVLATLRQISHRVSEFIGNPLTSSSEGIATFANSTYIYLPESCQYTLILRQRILITFQSSCQMVLDNPYRHLQECYPVNKKGNLFATPRNKLKGKIKIQEAANIFQNYKRFII